MTKTGDRSFDWVAALAFAFGVAVIVPSLLALALAIVAVLGRLL